MYVWRHRYAARFSETSFPRHMQACVQSSPVNLEHPRPPQLQMSPALTYHTQVSSFWFQSGLHAGLGGHSPKVGLGCLNALQAATVFYGSGMLHESLFGRGWGRDVHLREGTQVCMTVAELSVNRMLKWTCN